MIFIYIDGIIYDDNTQLPMSDTTVTIEQDAASLLDSLDNNPPAITIEQDDLSDNTPMVIDNSVITKRTFDDAQINETSNPSPTKK